MTTNDIDRWIEVLRCPVTGEPLRREGEQLVSTETGVRYPIVNGLPMLLADEAIQPDTNPD